MALSPKPDGGNCLAILLASAAASLQRQQQLEQQQLTDQNNHHQNQPQKIQLTKQKSSRPQSNHKQQPQTPQLHQHQPQPQQQQPQQQNGLNPLQLLLAKSKAMALHNKPVDPVEFRNLESWHDEDAGPTNESCLQELVDPGSNFSGWSADEMFKYNEKRHKITTSYSEKTLSDKYTTPLPKMSSRSNVRMANQLAKEIEERVQAEGRITPESSDDDELFEKERNKRIQMKQRHQLDQLQEIQHKLQRLSLITNSTNNNIDNSINTGKTSRTQSSSKHSNSTETPATASLSSSPTLNEPIIMKPVTSSSRNILRACLT